MTEASRPFDGTVVGDSGPYSAEQWRQIWRNVLGWGGERANVGVFLSSGTQPNDGLLVQAQSPVTTAIDVLRGAALVRGIFYLSDATVAFVVANNASGNPRIDTVVLRADYIAQTVRLALKQGAPAASPTPPSLTQTAGVIWEIPIADIAVANGFTSIASANISSRREWINAASGVYLDNVLNNSGVTLNDGDVVIWDDSADRAVTVSTTINDPDTAGTWVGSATPGTYGRVLVDGIGYIRTITAVTRGDHLTTSTVAGSAQISNGIERYFLARALETTSAAGLALAYVQGLSENEGQFTQTANQNFSNSSAENTLFSTGVGTLTLPANKLTVGKSIRISIAGFINTAAAAGTATLRLRLGGVLIAASSAITLTNSITNRGFEIEGLITCRSVGPTGSVIGQGMFQANMTGINSSIIDILATAAVAVDTTIPLAVNATWQFGTANIGNTITITNAVVKVE
jgi:hypothetical protein